ncbi:hypothetical protein F2Q69_00031539 [Brassica cretica]|uniref:Uncharacterized protein n=1 Tax=Brassica cretica TaxID=69181 RepID=A0A8S9S133_BRACR|nr:hypothetical protein F2Q69_00031539 [Brassica cretica]
MAKKKCELCDGVAAASPRRSIATTTARPVGFALRLLPSSIAVSALNQVWRQ